MDRPQDERDGGASSTGRPPLLSPAEPGGELMPRGLSGEEPLREPVRSGARLGELYQARVRALPGAAQMLLLLAAANGLGDPANVCQAATQLEIGQGLAELPAVGRLV